MSREQLVPDEVEKDRASEIGLRMQGSCPSTYKEGHFTLFIDVVRFFVERKIKNARIPSENCSNYISRKHVNVLKGYSSHYLHWCCDWCYLGGTFGSQHHRLDEAFQVWLKQPKRKVDWSHVHFHLFRLGFSGANRNKNQFPVQIANSESGTHTRLTASLLKIMTMYTYSRSKNGLG